MMEFVKLICLLRQVGKTNQQLQSRLLCATEITHSRMARGFNYVMGEPCGSPMIKKRLGRRAIELNLVRDIEVF